MKILLNCRRSVRAGTPSLQSLGAVRGEYSRLDHSITSVVISKLRSLLHTAQAKRASLLARALVGESDGGFVVAAGTFDGERPDLEARGILAFLGGPKDGAGAVDKEHAEIGIASL